MNINYMKNLEQIIVENLIRFRPKNLDSSELKKFLTEQDLDFVERWKNEKAAIDLFRKWESEVANDGRTKLVKANGYKDVTGEPIIVPVSFWNNFVTIDSMNNADQVKKQLDDVLTVLQQQGVNLEDPTINIKIVSRATSPVASTAPSSKENTGKKRIDHDYNGLLKFDANGNVTPESKAAFAEKQKADPQWGNKILAQKRGDAAANYIKAKGIKANITIVPEINAPRREFVISAKVAGKEKYIAPLKLPDMTTKIILNAEWVVTELWSMGDKIPVTIPTFYYRIEWSNTNGQSGWAMTQDKNNSPGELNDSRWMRKQELEIVAKTGTGPPVARNRNPLQANHSSNFAGSPGEAQTYRKTIFMAGSGYFAGQGAVSNVLWDLSNGASKLVSQITGFNLGSWLSSTSATMGATSDISIEYPGQIYSLFGRKLASAERINGMNADSKPYYGDLAKAKAAAPGTKVSIEKTINLQELAAAAAASGYKGVSAELSTDPKFWSEAAWFDSTVTPPTYGIDLKQNPKFFEGATFSKTPINK